MTKKGSMLAAFIGAVVVAALLPFIGSGATADVVTAVAPEGCTEVEGSEGGVVFRCAEDGGLLRLHLGEEDRFRYEPDSDGDGVPDSESGGPAAPVDQSIGSTACRLSLGEPELVELSAGPWGAKPGVRHDSIGVRYFDGPGAWCARVEGHHETLTLSLGSASEVDGKLIDRAELDIERKYDAVVRLDFYEGGRHGTKVGSLVVGCSHGQTDCGPDSDDGDNVRLVTDDPPGGQTPPGPFDTIVFSNHRHGAFSLEGGADGTAPGPLGSTLGIDPHDSLFHLVTFETRTYEGTLDCGDAAETDLPSGSGSTSATVERLGDKGDPPGSDCDAVPYNFTGEYDGETDTQAVDFEVDTSNEPDAQFGLVVDWDLETAQNPLSTPTQVVFEPGGEPVDLQWCGGTYQPDAPTRAERLAMVEAIPGVGACLAHQEITVADGMLSVTEVILVSDDPRFLR